MMNKRIKARWVKALRSGKFKQGRGKLKTGKGKAATYCCLGVLCAVERMRRGPANQGLTYSQLKRVGLTPEQHDNLAIMNDKLFGDRHVNSFRKIASYIEKRL